MITELLILIQNLCIQLLVAFRRHFSYFVLHHVMGWKTKSRADVYKQYSKGKHVWIYVHTSALDPLLGILLAYVYDLPLIGVGKKEAGDIPIIGRILKKMDVILIDRKKNTNTTTYIANELNKRDNFVFSIAPEGTRKRTSCLRSGYFHIAKKTGSAIQMVTVDFSKNIYDIEEIANDVTVQTTTYEKIKQKTEDTFSREIPYYPNDCYLIDTESNQMPKTSMICLRRSILVWIPPCIVAGIVAKVLAGMFL
jgi:1-acyl-sn-glycerol-3-phosphate acyltransferase